MTITGPSLPSTAGAELLVLGSAELTCCCVSDQVLLFLLSVLGFFIYINFSVQKLAAEWGETELVLPGTVLGTALVLQG